MNVVGYKVRSRSRSLTIVTSFYMNVVGYKDSLPAIFRPSTMLFYMNVVGYKAIRGRHFERIAFGRFI